LLAELARRASAGGHLVLQGTATELEPDFPFGLLVDAVDPYLRSLDGRPLGRLGTEKVAEVAWVNPAARSPRPSTSAASTVAERFPTLYAARESLDLLAARRALLVTLDDRQ
jgi:hypothetical protein